MAITLIFFLSLNAYTSTITIENLADINQVPDSSPSTNPYNLIEYDDMLYYFAKPAGEEHTQLWAHDPETKNNVLKFEFSTDNRTSDVLVFNDKLYFVYNDGIHGTELWLFDGATEIAELAINIRAEGSYSYNSSSPISLTLYNNQLYFIASLGTSGAPTTKHLFRFDTATNQASAVTQLSIDSNTPIDTIIYDNKLFFFALDENDETALWSYNHVVDSVEFKANVSFSQDYRNFTYNSHKAYFAIYDQQLYFFAQGDGVYDELWRYDSTSDSLSQLTELNGFYKRGIIVYDGELYFQYSAGLWRYNNVTNEPVLVSQFGFKYDPYADPTHPHFAVYNGKLYFNLLTYYDSSWAGDTEYIELDYEIHAYDSETGVSSTAVNSPGIDAYNSHTYTELTVFNDKLHFIYPDYRYGNFEGNGEEISAFDDSTSLTELITDEQSEFTESSDINFKIVFQDKLFFTATDGIHGNELWVYDKNSVIEIEMIDDINSTRNVDSWRGENSSSDPTHFVAFQNKLYFTADDGVNGRKLWVYEDEYNSVRLETKISASAELNTIIPLIAVDNNFYFNADEKVWQYNSDTGAVNEIVGIDTMLESILFNNQLYFSASSDVQENPQLYRLNSSTYEAELINDESYKGYKPKGFTIYNNKLYFFALDDVDDSRENKLWAFDDSTDSFSQIDTRLSYGFGTSRMEVVDGQLYYLNNYKRELWRYNSETESKLLFHDPQGIQYLISSYQNKLYYFDSENSWRYGSYGVLGVADSSGEELKYEHLYFDYTTFPIKYNNQLLFTSDNGLTGFEMFSLYDNRSPFISIVPPVSTFSAGTVVLDGSSSFDPLGGELSYIWQQEFGPPVVLHYSNGHSLAFQAPEVTRNETLTFLLTVSNGVTSSKEIVNVVILKNTAPIIPEMDNITIDEGSEVTIDASATSGVGGNELSFHWQQMSGPPITLSDQSASIITFTAPEVSQNQTITLTLTVSDGYAETISTVEVSVIHVNQAPTLALDAPESVDENNQVTISATVNDIDGDELTITWLQIAGSTAIDVSNANDALTFTAPSVTADGSYSFEVTVTDGELSATESVSVLITNKPESVVQKEQSSSGGSMAWLLMYLLTLLSVRMAIAKRVRVNVIG
ncbi:PKD domain-containing protein [Litorilituus lipolyticus]|uniref:Ig-like domain-containing protein n=1 Tax=Litorilituus lipolyticus TaxID=2491017 RepID=A0A502KZF3_9GAMM|nr:Ig-like domain-containing protein [Litorilituus lipolyticus]TPH17080.1 hypothetical protein EPA86_05195 [Litorilituus lipolyticus]